MREMDTSLVSSAVCERYPFKVREQTEMKFAAVYPRFSNERLRSDQLSV